MILPDLKHDFSHSLVAHVDVGPRREVALSIRVFEWSGRTGTYSDPKKVRFGGISNFDEAAAFFRDHPSLEVAFLRFSLEHKSKPGSFFIEISAERIDAELLIHCSSIQVI